MAKNWVRWHEEYEVEGSSLARRLAVVQDHLREALSAAGPAPRLISMCAGDGRDILPLLPPDAHAVLVELDPSLSRRAVAHAERSGLAHVSVRTEDAGTIDAYRDATPADIVLACGVFGNVTPEDAGRTVATLPALLAPGGTVIWTRAGDPQSAFVRDCFAASGFEELAFTAPADAKFRVGTHRLTGDPTTVAPGTRLFQFVP
jgi:hypothetical protein